MTKSSLALVVVLFAMLALNLCMVRYLFQLKLKDTSVAAWIWYEYWYHASTRVKPEVNNG